MTLVLLYFSIETISSIRVHVTIETLVEPFMCFNWNYRIAICFNWNYNKREKSQLKNTNCQAVQLWLRCKSLVGWSEVLGIDSPWCQYFWVSIVTQGICYNFNDLDFNDNWNNKLHKSICNNWNTCWTFHVFQLKLQDCYLFQLKLQSKGKESTKKHIMPSSAAVVKLLESGLVIRGTGDRFSRFAE